MCKKSVFKVVHTLCCVKVHTPQQRSVWLLHPPLYFLTRLKKTKSEPLTTGCSTHVVSGEHLTSRSVTVGTLHQRIRHYKWFKPFWNLTLVVLLNKAQSALMLVSISIAANAPISVLRVLVSEQPKHLSLSGENKQFLLLSFHFILFFLPPYSHSSSSSPALASVVAVLSASSADMFGYRGQFKAPAAPRATATSCSNVYKCTNTSTVSLVRKDPQFYTLIVTSSLYRQPFNRLARTAWTRKTSLLLRESRYGRSDGAEQRAPPAGQGGLTFVNQNETK